ncbi:MAG: endonuclease [Aliarcobacter sp.]
MQAARLAAWDFTGENNVATSAPEVYDLSLDSAPALTRGAGASASPAVDSFRTQSFGNDGISIANTDYFQITLSASSGKTLSLSSIDCYLAGTDTYRASPGAQSQFAYSLNGVDFVLIGSPSITTKDGAISQISLSGISALQNLADDKTVTLRFYATGQTSSGGWGFKSISAGSYGLDIGGTIGSAVTSSVPVVSNAAASAMAGTVFSYSIVASNSPLGYSMANGPSGLGVAPLNGIISGIIDKNAPGTYLIEIAANNSAGLGQGILSLTVSANSGAPVVNSPTSATATIGTIFSYEITTTLNSQTSVEAKDLPSWLTLDPTSRIISGTSSVSGTTQIQVRAINASGSSLWIPVSVSSVAPLSLPQTITFNNFSGSTTYGGVAPLLTATASSGLTVAYTSSNENVATILNGALKITGVGNTIITASQAGGGNYLPAPSVERTLTITKRPVTVTANRAAKNVGESDPSFTFSSTGLIETSGLTGTLTRVLGETSGTYAITQGSLAVSANYTLTFVGANFVVTKLYNPPASYYDSALGKMSTDLKASLNSITKTGFRSIPYGSGTSTGITGVVPVLKLLYQDPANADNLILIYGGESVLKTSWDTVWNREHCWPQSFGASNGYAQSDLFHLRPCRGTVNSDRNNDVYGNVTISTGAKTAPACRELEYYVWEPPDSEKGQIARGILYMAVRYEGASSGDGGTANLELIDGASDVTSASHRFGQLTDLLAWNRLYPPNEKEKWINDQIYTKYQLNRNPFIDNPDYAEMVFRGVPSVSVSLGQNGAEAGPTTGKFTLKRLGPTTSSLTVQYTWSGSATPGTDTQSLGSSSTFAVGSDTVEVVITPQADNEIEGTEVLTLTLATSANYVSSKNSADVAIVDAPVANSKTEQTITFAGLAGALTFGGTPVTLTGSASSGLAVSYTSSNLSVVSVSGSQLTIVGAGLAAVTASQAGNGTYNAAIPIERSVTVEPKAVSISGAVAQNKVYDSTSGATVSGTPVLIGVVPGGDVALGSASAVFADAEVGAGKSVYTGYSLTGSQASNYKVVQPSGLTASITAAGLSVVGASGQSRGYDGSTAATLIGGMLVGVLGEDDVSLALNPTGVFASKEVGTWTVAANFALMGLDQGNYILAQPSGVMGTISAGTTLAGWASSKGLTGNSALASADPDRDGWSNEQEYAFGLDPVVASGSPLTISQAAGQMKMFYNQKVVGGVTYTVRSATSLGAGFNGTVTSSLSSPQPSVVPDGYKQYEATFTSGGDQEFFKVEAVVP